MRKVDLSLVADYIMPSGIGTLAAHQACLVAQAAIVDALSKGDEIGDLTDTLDCACPVLRVLAIALNDTNWWASNEERTEILRPLIPLLLDSRRAPDVTAQRAAKAALFAQYAAQSAAQSAAEYATESATESAKCAAKSAAKSAAQSAAEYAAQYAEYAAKSAAKSDAEYAQYAAKSLCPLRDELLRVWIECEGIQRHLAASETSTA